MKLGPTLAMFALLACLASGGALRAQEVSASHEEYVDSGRDALSGGRLPWYDKEQDDLRAINVPPSDAGQFQNRESRWNASPAKTKSTNTNINTPSWSTSFGEWLWWTIKALAIIALVAVVAVLLWLMLKAYLSREEAAAVNTKAKFSENVEDEEERIESLPFTVARPRGDLLDEALAQYQAGNFRLAVIYLYSYLLIQLDRHQQIHLARGKTNRTYLRELRQQPGLRSILERTMVAFEDVFFGNHTLTREEFEACWGQLDAFHKQVEQATT